MVNIVYCGLYGCTKVLENFNFRIVSAATFHKTEHTEVTDIVSAHKLLTPILGYYLHIQSEPTKEEITLKGLFNIIQIFD